MLVHKLKLVEKENRYIIYYLMIQEGGINCFNDLRQFPIYLRKYKKGSAICIESLEHVWLKL